MRQKLAVWWCRFIHEPEYRKHDEGPWFAYCDECGLQWAALKYRPAA